MADTMIAGVTIPEKEMENFERYTSFPKRSNGISLKEGVAVRTQGTGFGVMPKSPTSSNTFDCARKAQDRAVLGVKNAPVSGKRTR